MTYDASLIFRVAQIVDGDTTCSVCGSPAALIVANGADPDDDPVCAAHGLEWLRFTTRSIEGLFMRVPA